MFELVKTDYVQGEVLWLTFRGPFDVVYFIEVIFQGDVEIEDGEVTSTLCPHLVRVYTQVICVKDGVKTEDDVIVGMYKYRTLETPRLLSEYLEAMDMRASYECEVSEFMRWSEEYEINNSDCIDQDNKGE
jgi:hypothetical protein